jgi:hypothetical protein
MISHDALLAFDGPPRSSVLMALRRSLASI